MQRWDKCTCLLWKNTSIDCSDWPLHTHTPRLFEPVQSALLEERIFFSLPELLPFFHWLHMFNNDEKKKEFSAGRCWFSAPRVTSPSLWLTSVAATHVDVLRLWKGRRRDDLRVNSTGGTDHGPIMSVLLLILSLVGHVTLTDAKAGVKKYKLYIFIMEITDIFLYNKILTILCNFFKLFFKMYFILFYYYIFFLYTFTTTFDPKIWDVINILKLRHR